MRGLTDVVVDVSAAFAILHEAENAQAAENEEENDENRRNENEYPIEGHFTF